MLRGTKDSLLAAVLGSLLALGGVWPGGSAVAQDEPEFVLRPGLQTLPRGAFSLADLNVDRRTDVISLSQWPETDISVVLMGAGADEEPAVTYDIPQAISSNVAVGDIDNDADVDLIFATGGSLRYLPNEAGRGTFGPATFAFHQDQGAVYRLLVADLSGDQSPELVLLHGDASSVISVFPNLASPGEASFGEPATYEVGGEAWLAATADFNDDGFLDLAVHERSGGTISVFTNRGDGTFGESLLLSSYPRALELFAADLDGDGAEDLFVGAYSETLGGWGHLYRNTQDGMFAVPTLLPTGEQFGSRVTDLGDYDGDGDVDVVTREDRSVARVWLQGPDGTYNPSTRLEVEEAYSVRSGDFDRDGDIDLVAGRERVDLYLNQRVHPEPRFAPVFVSEVTDVDVGGRAFIFSGITEGRAIAAGDFDDDGLSDLLIANDAAGTLTLVHGSPNLASPRQRDVPVPVGRLTSAAVGEVDGNPPLDVAIASRDSVLVLLPGLGDGTFGEARVFPTGPQPLLVKAADLDGDGFTDWLVPNPSADLTVYWGTGDADLVERGDVFARDFQFDVATADFTGDGRVDIAVTRRGRVYVMDQIEDRVFSAPRGVLPISLASLRGSTEARHVVSGDLDGDGHPDLVTMERSTATDGLRVLMGREGDFFEPVDGVRSFITDNSSLLDPTDLNGDGILDVALVSLSGFPSGSTQPLFTVLLGLGDGTFQSAEHFEMEGTPLPAPFDLAAGDFDGDGDLDVAALGTRPLQILVNETPGPVRFRRGDVDADDDLTLNDAVRLLNFLFGHGAPPTCRKAADAGDDGVLGMDDAIKVLGFLFQGSEPLAPPFLICGSDPTPDRLSCIEYPPCD